MKTENKLGMLLSTQVSWSTPGGTRACAVSLGDWGDWRNDAELPGSRRGRGGAGRGGRRRHLISGRLSPVARDAGLDTDLQQKLVLWRWGPWAGLTKDQTPPWCRVLLFVDIYFVLEFLLWSLDWPATRYLDQTGLDLTDEKIASDLKTVPLCPAQVLFIFGCQNLVFALEQSLKIQEKGNTFLIWYQEKSQCFYRKRKKK